MVKGGRMLPNKLLKLLIAVALTAFVLVPCLAEAG
jgi:hypothetical protein